MSTDLDEYDEEEKKVVPEISEKEKIKLQSIAILQKPLYVRTAKEKEIVQTYASKVDFFKPIMEEQGPISFAKLCDSLNYQFLPAEKILFKTGDIGSTFYIILEGTVEVIINFPVKDEQGRERMEPRVVRELGEGQSFGELALQEGVDRTRKATIASKKGCPCHFATLDRQPFLEMLTYFAKVMNEQIHFLENIPFFRYVNWSRRAVQQCLKFFEMTTFTMNHVLYKEGDPCDDIYLVKSGEVRFTKAVDIKQQKVGFEFDEDNRLHPSKMNLVTKFVELGTGVTGQFVGDEEALFSYYLKIKNEWIKEYSNSRGKIEEEREILMMKIESLIRRDWNVPQGYVSNVHKKSDELKYQTNSSVSGRIIREATVTVKSSKAEIWRISAKDFFLQLETNPQAYNYLLAKIEQGRKRRDERLPSLAKFTPTANNYKGRRQRLVPSDDSYLLKEKRERLQARSPTKPSISVIQEKRDLELSREDSKQKITEQSPVKGESSQFLNTSFTKTLRKTSQQVSFADEKLPTISNFTQLKEQSPQKLEPTPLGLAPKFSHTFLSLVNNIHKNQEWGVQKISFRKDSSPMPREESGSFLAVEPPKKALLHQNSHILDESKDGGDPRSRSVLKNRSMSLYDDNSPTRLFAKAEKMKPKKSRTMQIVSPPKLKKKETSDSLVSNDSLLHRLIGTTGRSAQQSPLKQPLKGQNSPPKIRINFVKEYLNRDNTEYKTPLVERFLRNRSIKELLENQKSSGRFGGEAERNLGSMIKIIKINNDKVDSYGNLTTLEDKKSVTGSFRNVRSRSQKF